MQGIPEGGCRGFQREGEGDSRGRVKGIPEGGCRGSQREDAEDSLPEMKPSSSSCSFLKVFYLTSQLPFLSGAATP